MEKEKGISVSKFKKICVFCVSNQGKKRSYQDAAINLAKELDYLFSFYFFYFPFHCSLLFFFSYVPFLKGNLRLMGLISQAVFDGGRHVLGL
ncbi:hypothetical protein DsansV1_C02g0015521 [Dioscorea sansibarensis]